jgi:RNA polymerase sigma-70 factor (ECF subfamily)
VNFWALSIVSYCEGAEENFGIMAAAIPPTDSLNRSTVPLPPSRAREQFSQIARACEAALLRAALRFCKGGHDCAQDLVQETLVRGYDAFRLGKYREVYNPQENQNPQAWLLRILTNKFFNDYRRSARWEAGITVDTLTSGGAAGPESTRVQPVDQPEGALLEEILDERLVEALNRLPEALRLAVILVDVQGQSYVEAAEALGVPVGTVRSRLSRSRHLLHESLKEFASERRLL